MWRTRLSACDITSNVVLCLVVLAVACGSPAEPEAGKPQVPAAIRIVSGNDQEGTTARILAKTLIAQVTDSAGNGVPGVRVTWNVARGDGDFRAGSEVRLGPQTTSFTDGLGFAQIGFVPRTMGRILVIAQPSDASVPFVTFAADVRTLLIYWWGELSHRNVEVSLGDTVLWDGLGDYRVRSFEAPPDGTAFDSGTVFDEFRFVPNVTGTWKYRAEYPSNPGYEDVYTISVR